MFDFIVLYKASPRRLKLPLCSEIIAIAISLVSVLDLIMRPIGGSMKPQSHKVERGLFVKNIIKIAIELFKVFKF